MSLLCEHWQSAFSHLVYGVVRKFEEAFGFGVNSLCFLIKDTNLFYFKKHSYIYFLKECMFSKACEYAIRALIFIAQKTEHGGKVGIKEISQGIASPEHFIAKILQDLARKGLVESAKGPHGGFFLGENSRRHTLADIVNAVDGDLLFTGCALGLESCSEKKPCPLHDQFKAIRNEMHDMLQSASVGEFNKELALGIKHLKR